MARPLSGRVARLERARSPACPACGGGGPGPVTFRVVSPEPADRVSLAHAPRPPTRCRACGRPTEFCIDMVAARGGG